MDEAIDPIELFLEAARETEGSYHSFLYVVESQHGPEALRKDNIRDHLRNAAQSGDKKSLSALIGLVHEVNHLVTYLSTNFGLESAILIDTCLWAILTSEKRLNTPMMSISPDDDPYTIVMKLHLTDFAGGLVKELACVQGRREMRPGDHADGFSLHGVPMRTPLAILHQLPILEAFDIRKAREMGAIVERHYEHVFTWPINDSELGFIELNATALMECLAILAEGALGGAYKVANGLPIGPSGMQDTLNLQRSMVYRACFMFYEQSGVPPIAMEMTLPALIDIAFMYTPKIARQFNIVQEEYQDRDDWYPVDVFLDACLAARGVLPLREYSVAEVQRFQDDVCKAMDIPSTMRLTELGIEYANSMHQSQSSIGTIVGLQPQIKLHADMLEVRKRSGDGWIINPMHLEYLSSAVSFLESDSKLMCSAPIVG